MSPSSARRWGAASRTLAGIGGGYLLGAMATAGLALWAPLDREQAVIAATLPAFAIYTAVIVWAFAARSALRVWLGLAVVALPLAAGLAGAGLPWGRLLP